MALADMIPGGRYLLRKKSDGSLRECYAFEISGGDRAHVRTSFGWIAREASRSEWEFISELDVFSEPSPKRVRVGWDDDGDGHFDESSCCCEDGDYYRANEVDAYIAAILRDSMRTIKLLNAFAVSAEHVIGATCYEHDDNPAAWDAMAEAWEALERAGLLVKKPKPYDGLTS